MSLVTHSYPVLGQRSRRPAEVGVQVLLHVLEHQEQNQLLRRAVHLATVAHVQKSGRDRPVKRKKIYILVDNGRQTIQLNNAHE